MLMALHEHGFAKGERRIMLMQSHEHATLPRFKAIDDSAAQKHFSAPPTLFSLCTYGELPSHVESSA